MKDKSKLNPVKEVDGKMECPFCKMKVKNLDLHFTRAVNCGKNIDREHFTQLFQKIKSMREKEMQRNRKQAHKEKQPRAKIEEHQRRKAKDLAKYKGDQKMAREKIKEKDLAKYKANQHEKKTWRRSRLLQQSQRKV